MTDSPDSPEPAASPEPADSPDPTELERAAGAQPASGRVHRLIVPTLLVVATLIGTLGAFSIWINRQALNTSNWASTSGKVLEDKRVQTALSAYLVHELFTSVNVAGELQTVLPKQLQPLAGPVSAGVQQLAGQLAPKVLASPQAQDAWVQVNIAAHRQLLKVLAGGGSVVATKAGVVTLNLRTLVDQLASTLGISSQVAAVRAKLQGSTGAKVRSAAQQQLGITLPPASGELVILRSNQLKTAQDIVNALKSLAVVLPALALVLFAAAVYLARGRRRRTLRSTGWCLVLIGVALVLIRRIGGDTLVNSLVKMPSNKPAVHDVWTIATSLLYALAVALIIYGLVIVAAAWLAGPTRPATAIRRMLAPTLSHSPAVAYLGVGGVLLVLVAWGPTPALRNILWILVFAVLLALGVTMLRREAALEFPAAQEAAHPQPGST